MYYIYMLRCKDDSLYTGMTTNIDRRMQEHFSKGEKCAKYTLVHVAQKLEGVWQTETRKAASKLEYHIKKLSKKQKEILLLHPHLLNTLLPNINPDDYRNIVKKEKKGKIECKINFQEQN